MPLFRSEGREPRLLCMRESSRTPPSSRPELMIFAAFSRDRLLVKERESRRQRPLRAGGALPDSLGDGPLWYSRIRPG
jgi:hypothetical protein